MTADCLSVTRDVEPLYTSNNNDDGLKALLPTERVDIFFSTS